MKTLKRVSALALALFICMSMGAWAAELAVSETDWGFETGPNNNYSTWSANYVGSEKIGMPYVNRAYSENQENVHGGTRSLRLMNDGTNPEMTETSVYAVAPRLKAFGTNTSIVVPANTRVLLEGFIKVAELEEGAKAEVLWYYGRIAQNKSTVLSITEANNTWQKFSYKPAWWAMNSYKDCYLVLSLTGKGTVYFDDIFCGLTDNTCVNGDFEMGAATAAPENWNVYQIRGSGAQWGSHFLMQEGTHNRYISVKTINNKLGYIFQQVSLQAGARYKLTFRQKAFQGGNEINGKKLPLIAIGTVKNNDWYVAKTFFTHTLTGKDAEGWNLYESTCVLPETIDFTPNLFIVNGGGDAGWDEMYFDDVKLSIDSTPVLVKAEDGKSVTAMSHVVALADRPSTLFVGAYRKDTNGNLCLVNLSSVSTVAVAAGETQKLEKSITLPDYGNEYVVRAFLWDGISTLGAQTASVTLTN